MSFDRYQIDDEENLFPLLYQSVEFESFSIGRQIANLHRQENGHIPLIRTTTIYERPSQPFTATHQTVIDKIREASGIESLDLNNAMLEVYDYRYKTMGFHTDQALDMNPDSSICLFSCYEEGKDDFPRLLTVKNKESGDEFDVPLLHHSVVIFSVANNRNHIHKIERRDLPNHHANRWMGFTLRLSKNCVKSIDGTPHLTSNGNDLGELTLASETERRNFFRFKGQENRDVSFEWPEIRYTISPSDLMATFALTQPPDP